MATGTLEVTLTLDETLRSYFMERRRSLLTELDNLEKLLGVTPRTSEIRKAQKAANPPPQYNCEYEFNKREEKEGE
jgi:hypothetical protein